MRGQVGSGLLPLMGMFTLVLLVSIATHTMVRSKLADFRADLATTLGQRAAAGGHPRRAGGAVNLHKEAEETLVDAQSLLKQVDPLMIRLGNATNEMYSWMKTHLMLTHEEQRDVVEPRPTRICIPISITTRGTKWKRLEDMLLLTSFMPSLVATVEPGFQFGVYLGYDEGDPLLDSEAGQKELTQLMRRLVGRAAIEVRSFRYADSQNRNVWAVNYVSRECYLEGYDYFYRVNDDSAMKGRWASALTARLRATHDFGVVGTFDQGNPRIFTHSMVGRPHLEVFGYYFPFEFGNYWSDDWITDVYEPPYMHRAYDVEVKHHIHAERYKVEHARKRLLTEMVTLCRRRWKAYLCLVKKRHDYCGKDTAEFEGVWP